MRGLRRSTRKQLYKQTSRSAEQSKRVHAARSRFIYSARTSVRIDAECVERVLSTGHSKRGCGFEADLVVSLRLTVLGLLHVDLSKA